MSLVDLTMPKLGESIMEATILKWHKNVGDKVLQDETILDIATDKVDSEVPSTAEGIIEEILFKVDDVVPIGTVIVRIRTGAAEVAKPATPATPKQEYEEAKIVEDIPYVPQAENNTAKSEVRFYSPLVLNIAQSEGISMTELENIVGTGQDGRVSKKDILAHVAAKATGGVNTQPATKIEAPVTTEAPIQQAVVIEKANTPVVQATNNPPAVISGNVEVIEMDRMRKLIAKHMVDSKHTSPHVTSFAECDVTNLVQWRERVKKDFEKREGEKITFTPLFIEAIVISLA
jgi:2-oxoglutarate dehydrogenase E2 component (dihydrolipoamide succinyltransferase)